MAGLYNNVLWRNNNTYLVSVKSIYFFTLPSGETKPTPPSNKKPKKSKKKENDSAAQLNNEDSRSSAVSSSSAVDIPIFRDEFLELNKARETELRTLKKTVNEFEEQTAVLQKHVNTIKSH